MLAGSQPGRWSLSTDGGVQAGRGAGHWVGGGARVKRELMQCNEPQLLLVVVVDLVHARTHRDGSIALTAPNYDRPIYRPLPKLDPLGAAGTNACL